MVLWEDEIDAVFGGREGRMITSLDLDTLIPIVVSNALFRGISSLAFGITPPYVQ